MADVTATEMNTQLGVTAFDDNGGAGPLTLNCDTLTGDSLTLTSGVAEVIFKVVKGASDTAAAKEDGTDTYPAITRSIRTTNGVDSARYSGTVNVSAPLDYDEVTAVS